MKVKGTWPKFLASHVSSSTSSTVVPKRQKKKYLKILNIHSWMRQYQYIDLTHSFLGQNYGIWEIRKSW